MRIAAIVALCAALTGTVALARPSPYPPVTQFVGDRYASAQLGPEVVKSAKAKQGAKARKKPKVRVKHVPGMVARLSLPEGIAREAVRVAGRPAAWCGWWLGQHLGMPLRKLWLARNWASVGSNAGGPGPGVIVVWPHHVGIITGRRGNQWVVKSGNDGRRVRERPRSVAGAIAFRTIGGRG